MFKFKTAGGRHIFENISLTITPQRIVWFSRNFVRRCKNATTMTVVRQKFWILTVV